LIVHGCAICPPPSSENVCESVYKERGDWQEKRDENIYSQDNRYAV
jgi:hypothetical protein